MPGEALVEDRRRSQSARVSSLSTMPASTHDLAASSHWLRLKMKKIDGSSFLSSRSSTVSTRPGRGQATTADAWTPLALGCRPSSSVRGRRRIADSSSRSASRFDAAAEEHVQQVEPFSSRSATRYLLSSATGRVRSMTASVGPRTVLIQSASSSTLLTVADRAISRTCWGRWMITSSHTGPRIRVLEEVHLVDHDGAEVVERASGVDHVAQHLGRHHHDRCVTVDRVVAGQQADGVDHRGLRRGRGTSGSTAP